MHCWSAPRTICSQPPAPRYASSFVPIALDATYSFGSNLTGVGVYSREILYGLAAGHPNEEFLFCYRPHRFLPSYREKLPPNAVRRLLIDTPPGDLFHALNQRVDAKARRTVCTFHDLFVMTGEYSTAEFRARFTDQARRAAERSDVIIAVSHFTAEQVRDLLGVMESQIRVIHHGVRMPAGMDDSLRENLILTVGAIQKRKNVARIVKAFEQMPAGWRLTIAGSPDGFGAAEELRAVEESPRRAEIDVPGYVSAGELESLYRRAKVFAFPSLDEGFGMPVLDAMAHGIAVITSNVSAMREVARDAAMLVDPLSADEIAAAMKRLVEDDALRMDLVRRGRERAALFTWESAVEKTWRVYDEIR
jgi:glycosyltransferase involved in cell wall biosynthesis